MHIGLNTYSYHLAFGKHPDRRADGPMTLAKCLNRARDLGFEAVQVDCAHFNAEKDNPKWVKRMADSLGLALEAGAEGIEPEALSRGLALAAEWHSPVLRTVLSWERPRLGRHAESAIARAAETIRSSLLEAEKFGVVIAVENHHDIGTPDLLLLMEKIGSPQVGVCLDVGNSMTFLEDPVWTAEQLAPHAVSAHLKDYLWKATNYGGKLVGAPLGTGSIDLDRVIPILLEAPRLTRIFIECPTEAAGTDSQMIAAEDAAVAASVGYWKRWMPKHGKP